ncbi:MAG: PEP-CTERM sorting domain-containing protein [Thermoguttaceae bacterium]
MRHISIWVLGVLLLGATAASADSITISNTGPVTLGLNYLGSARTACGTFDKLELDITAISGDPNSADTVTMLSGGYWCTDTGFYLPGSTDSMWKSTSTNYVGVLSGGTKSTQFAFQSQTGKLYDGVTAAFRSGTVISNQVYTMFGDTWLNSDPDCFLTVGTPLAVLWVKQGWTTILWRTAGIGPSKLENFAGIATKRLWLSPETITITAPEPSTLALSATGLVALLAFAWRRRK